MPILLGALVVFFLFIITRLLLNARPETLTLLFKGILGAVVVIGIVLLILSGRFVNVIVGLFALIPLLPTLRIFFRKTQTRDKDEIKDEIADSFTSMTVAQAREILNVSENADVKQIKAAHRCLIQKIHPDQNGTNYLAVQVNRAREILLKEINSK